MRVAFGRGSVKVAVPLNLNPYHTTLGEKETRVSAQDFLEMDSSHRAALHRELDKPGDVLTPGVSPAGAPFWKEGGRPRRGWEKCVTDSSWPRWPPASHVREDKNYPGERLQQAGTLHRARACWGLLLVQVQLLPQCLRVKRRVLSVPLAECPAGYVSQQILHVAVAEAGDFAGPPHPMGPPPHLLLITEPRPRALGPPGGASLGTPRPPAALSPGSCFPSI